jgi:hypothetical protein
MRSLAAGMSIAHSQQVDSREVLGDVRYEAAAARGIALSFEAVIAFALDEIDAARAVAGNVAK